MVYLGNTKSPNLCPAKKTRLLTVFIDLRKAFELVSHDGLFKMMPKIGCPPKLLSTVGYFHQGMISTGHFNGDISTDFSKPEGCVLAPTLYALLLKHAINSSENGVYLHCRSNGCLFNLSRLGEKTKVRKVLIRDIPFAAAIASHHHHPTGF
jgi:hypothetical protein